MQIIEFLAARYSEDEADAKDVHRWDCPYLEPTSALGAACECGVPAKLLADLRVKRRLLADHQLVRATDYDLVGKGDVVLVKRDGCACGETDAGSVGSWPCEDLLIMVQPYASHPDFDPAWRAA